MEKYFYVYVLRSLRDNLLYNGYTSDLQKRIELHNKGEVQSTKKRIPLKLIYWEGCLNQQDATKREKYLKTAWEKRYLKKQANELSHGIKMYVPL